MLTYDSSIDTDRIDPRLAERIPQYIARFYCIFPVYDAGTHVVIATPFGKVDDKWLEGIAARLNIHLFAYDFEQFRTAEIRAAIEKFYKDRRMKLGEMLVVSGSIDEKQLVEALHFQESSPGSKIGEILRKLGYVEETAVQEMFARQIGYRFLPMNETSLFDVSLISRLSRELVFQRKVLPLAKGSNVEDIYLVAVDKVDDDLISEVKQKLGIKLLEPALTTETEFNRAVNRFLRKLEERQNRQKPLGRLLLERNLIESKQLEKALHEQSDKDVRLGELLISKGLVPERAVLELLSKKLGIEYIERLPLLIPPEFRSLLTEKFTVFNKLVPCAIEGKTLLVAMAYPQDRNLLNMLRNVLRREIKPVLASTREITRAIQRLYSDSCKDTVERVDLKKSVEIVHDRHDDSQHSTKRVINLVNNILADGVARGASDVHITPKEESVDLFFRLDGSLVKMDELPLRDRDNVISRVKIMSDMRIDARHIPQSGRIVARVGDRHIDFRVSTLPTQFGENVVLRILDSSKLVQSDLGKLGMPEAISSTLLEQSERSQGIILVTGPTGSGKTTTLYHVLNWLHQQYPQNSISTIENPIEYVLEGIVQSEVNEARGLTNAAILKEKLRQDPDVIMVGEIRNLEEGELAFTAALTGHLVLSTLHTNDGATTLRRLVEMGLEPYNVSTAINCVLSQRLAKRVCEHCRRPYQPTAREVEQVQRTHPDFDPAAHQLLAGLGCDHCNGGYKGRVGIYELLMVDAKVKQLISQNATDSKIRDAAVRGGMKTLRTAGLELAQSGVTTISEVLRVTDVLL